MSAKQLANAVGTAHALTKDIAGNLLSGQDKRVTEYLASLMAVLAGIEEKLAAGNDVRAEMKLNAVLKAAYENLNKMTPFDPTLAEAAQKKWDDLGVSISDLLEPIGETA